MYSAVTIILHRKKSWFLYLIMLLMSSGCLYSTRDHCMYVLGLTIKGLVTDGIQSILPQNALKRDCNGKCIE